MASPHDPQAPKGVRRSASVTRRNFLRGMLGGAAVSISLPILECMLGPHGEAMADGSPIPTRFGVFYWGCGIRHETWLPDQTGPNFELPHAFQAWGSKRFEHLRDYLTMVTGTSHSGSSPGHIPARGIALSSSHDMTINQTDNVGRYRGQNHPEPSIDALVAEKWAGDTPFDHIAASISQQKPYQNNSSWQQGGQTYNRHEPDPRKLWNYLFSDLADRHEQQKDLLETTTKLESSMLDAVHEDARKLRDNLGANDRRRLEQHLEGIRDMERRLQNRDENGAATCQIPDEPADRDYGERTRSENREAKNEVMADLVAHAFACDLARVFSYEWSATQSNAVYWEVGATGEHHHEYSHLASRQGGRYRGVMQDIVQFIMKNFAVLADSLYQTPAADGKTLLDHTLLLGTSAHADGGHHNYRDHPFVFVGKGSDIKPGEHIRITDRNTAAPRVLLTTVRSLGIDIDGFGQKESDGNRYATKELPEMLES